MLCLALLLPLAFSIPVQEAVPALPLTAGELERVTVYSGQALVERTVSVQQAALGPLTIQIGPLPMSVHPGSLQAQVLSGDAVVQGLEAILRSGAAQATAREEEIATKRRELGLTYGRQMAEVRSLEATLTGLAAMTAHLGEDPSLSGLLEGDLQTRLATLREQVLHTEQDLVTARRGAKDTQLALEDLDRLQPGEDTRDYREVAISLFMQQAGVVQVRLTYLVDGAAWKPAYDLRVAPDLTGLQVNFLAEVQQRTGEDWAETEVVLSTSMPHLGLDPPIVPRRVVDSRRSGRVLETLGYASGDDLASLEPLAGLAAASRAAAPTVQVRDFGITTQFVLPGRTSLASTGQVQRFRIRDLPLEVRPERYVVPSLSDKAYLRAEITNTGEVPLMAGSAKVFLGPDYLGEATMPLLRQGDQTMVNLGIDPNLTVEFETLKDERDNPGRFSLSSTATILREYRATLSLSAAARGRISVLIEESLPMSWTDEIDVEVPRAQPPALDSEEDLKMREERGLYRWRLYMSPGASQAIRWSYELSFDEDLLPVINEN